MKKALATLLVLLGSSPWGLAGELFDDATLQFAAKLDLRTLSLLAVQHEGRAGILDTFARERLSRMCSSERIDGTEPAFACMELHFNAGAYLTRPVISVREKKMQSLLARNLEDRFRDDLLRTGRLAPVCLFDSRGLAWDLLWRCGRASLEDLRRASGAPSVRGALERLPEHSELRVPVERLSVRYGAFLSTDGPRLIPAEDEWISAGDAVPEPVLRRPMRSATAWLPCLGAAAQAAPLAAFGRGVCAAAACVWGHLPPPTWVEMGMSAAQADAAARLTALGDAWRARDADAVNRLIAELSGLLPSAARAGEYPSLTVREMELLYNRLYKATITFAGFALATVLLIVAAASGRRWARLGGMGALVASTGALLAGFVGRWVLSGRAWYLPPIMNQFEAVSGSALLGAVVAIALETWWKRNYVGLAAAFYATVALLCGFLMPQMGTSISAEHGILASPVMAVHVAVIIVGHAMAGMTFFISVTYLGALAFRAKGGAATQGGASRVTASDSLAVIDRCNLIVAQLACWTIVLGTILGAYWGDFAWGRWWGWDPKEVWALITSLIYIAVLHLRLVVPARRRGLVTALGCIVGCLAMLFNWIVVNYLIAGKHSYA